MSTARAADETLHEALAHLNEAAKERSEEIQKLIDEKYTHLRDAFGGAARKSADWVREQGREAAGAAQAVDKSVRRYPWAYVGGAAATGFLVGLLVSRRK